jgi:hypothetical protein
MAEGVLYTGKGERSLGEVGGKNVWDENVVRCNGLLLNFLIYV